MPPPSSSPSHPSWGPSGPSWSRSEVLSLVDVLDDARRVLWRVSAVDAGRPTGDLAALARQQLADGLDSVHELVRSIDNRAVVDMQERRSQTTHREEGV